MSVSIRLEWLLDARRKYEMTGNPLYAWETFASCRSAGEDIPEWVLEYLDRAAGKLLEYAQHDPPPAKGETSTAVAVAMEMKIPGRSGQGTVFTQYVANEKNESGRRILQGVSDRMEAGDKDTHAFENVAKEFGVSHSTVRRAWQKFTKSD
jgi:hypothetical protein